MAWNTENKGKAKTVILILAAFLSTVALSISGELVDSTRILSMLAEEMDGVSIDNLIIFAALSVFYYKMDDASARIRHWSVYFIAALFSVFILIGLSFSQNGNLDFVVASKKQFCIAALTFVGYFFLLTAAVKALYLLLDRVVLKPQKAGEKKGRLRLFAERHSFISSFVIILLFWLPWLIVFLPGSVPYDGSIMLLMATGNHALTNMHSWPMVLLMGVLFRLGQNISANFGVFLIVAVSAIFEASCYAAVCRFAKKWTDSLRVQIGLALFFGLFPIFGAFAQTVMKDGPFMAAFTLYMALYIDTCITSRKTQKESNENLHKQVLWNLFWILVVGILVCILRNNGAYLVLPADLLLIVLVCKGMRKFAAITLVVATSCYWAYGNVLAPAVGVTDYSSRAMLSIPIQITARYLSVYPDDLTEDEVEVLSTVFYHYEVMGTDYNPENFDPVKVQYRISTEKEDLREYLKVVAAMCMRHPGVCLEAVLNQSFGYYYPFYNYTGLSGFSFYQESSTGLKDIYDISYVFSGNYRQALSCYAQFWKKAPVLSQMINAATPTWGLLFLAAYLTYKKKWVSILPLAAPAINMAICMVSPVNGYLRYAMPSLACFPLLVMWTVFVTKEEQDLPENAEES